LVARSALVGLNSLVARSALVGLNVGNSGAFFDFLSFNFLAFLGKSGHLPPN
jgi:hypothetical protein